MGIRQLWQGMQTLNNKKLFCFLFSIIFALLLTLLSSDASFTKIQNYVLFLLLLTVRFMVNGKDPFFHQYIV
ncbi:hypothetical protein AVEN109717_02140 [Avibacterium endocarditidis]